MACLPSGDQNTQRPIGMDAADDEPSATDVSMDTSSEPAQDSDSTAQKSRLFLRKFDVQVTEDVVYGQGLAHAEWRGRWHAYRPAFGHLSADSENPSMPVVVFIHGEALRGVL